LTPTATLLAQSACLPGLRAADCKLLADASNNMSKLTSFVLGYDISFKIMGASIGNVTLSIKGDGPIDFRDITDSDLQTVLTRLTLASTVEATVSYGSQSQTSVTDLRLIDGELYINDDMGSGWMQVSLNRLLEKYPGNYELEPFVRALRPDSMSQFLAFPNATKVLRGQRKNGPQIDGKPTAQMAANFDVAAYLRTVKNAAERKALLTTFLTNFLSGAGRRASRTQLQDPKLLAATERTITSTKISLVWVIGPADKLLHGIGFNLFMTVDGALVAAMDSAFGRSPMTVDLKILFTFSEIGTTVQIEPVSEETTDITDMVEQALGMQ